MKNSDEHYQSALAAGAFLIEHSFCGHAAAAAVQERVGAHGRLDRAAGPQAHQGPHQLAGQGPEQVLLQLGGGHRGGGERSPSTAPTLAGTDRHGHPCPETEATGGIAT